MSKKILIHCSKPAYGNSLSREAIDVALAAAAFDQNISLLFTGDGLFQLLNQQMSEAIHSKNHGKALSALSLYGVEDIFLCSDSMSERNLSNEDLILTGKSCNKGTIAELLNNQDVILNF